MPRTQTASPKQDQQSSDTTCFSAQPPDERTLKSLKASKKKKRSTPLIIGILLILTSVATFLLPDLFIPNLGIEGIVFIALSFCIGVPGIVLVISGIFHIFLHDRVPLCVPFIIAGIIALAIILSIIILLTLMLPS